MKTLREFRKQDIESILSEASELNVIDEAFSEANLRKVGELMSKMAAKRLGGKFYFLYTEEFKKLNGQKGIGSVFVSDNNKIIRYNYVSGIKGSFTINNIDYWTNKRLGSKPTITVNFDPEMNIVDISKELFEKLKNPKVNESINEALSPKERRARREEFIAQYGLPKSLAGNPKGLRERAYSLGKGAEYDALLETISVSKPSDETTSTSKKWRQDQKQLDSEAIYADPEFVFTDIEEATKVIARGKWRSLIIAGMGGIGKTYGAKQVLTQELGPYGEGPDSKWAFYEGLKTSGFGLFKLLLLNKKKVIVFDDSDSIWGDKDIINMMKIVTSDSGDRTISWSSNSTTPVALMSKSEREEYEMTYIAELMEDPNTKMKAPSSFNFEGQMINISNMAADKFDDAIKSRAIFINVYLAQRDVIRRMYTIKKLQGLSDEKIKFLLELIDPDAVDAIEGRGKYGGEIKYVTPEDARKNKHMNMRTLDIAEALVDADVKNLKHMVSMYA